MCEAEEREEIFKGHAVYLEQRRERELEREKERERELEEAAEKKVHFCEVAQGSAPKKPSVIACLSVVFKVQEDHRTGTTVILPDARRLQGMDASY